MRAPSPSETPRPHLAPGRNAEYLNSQFCQQEVEIARSIVAVPALHYDSHFDQIRSRTQKRNPWCARPWVALKTAGTSELHYS